MFAREQTADALCCWTESRADHRYVDGCFAVQQEQYPRIYRRKRTIEQREHLNA